MQRYFAVNKNLDLSTDDIYHITKVMRMNINDKIEVVYDKKLYLCNIDGFLDYQIKLSKIEELEQPAESPIDITIGVALIKEQKFDYVLQKATELGANNIIPLQMDRSIIKIDINREEKKRARWEKICKEAAEQSHRNTIPNVHKTITIEGIPTDAYNLKLLCSLDKQSRNIKEILQKKQNCDKILIVIGPEGGLTEKEEQQLVNKGFIRVSLGSHVLRTETVPLYILSILNYEFMR